MPKRVKAVLLGAGQHAELLYCHLNDDSDYEIHGFCIEGAYLKANELHGKPVIPLESILENAPPDEYALIPAVGYIGATQVRARLYRQCRALGYRFATYINPMVKRWPQTRFGDGVTVMESCVIQPFTNIHENVHLSTGCHIGHHCTVRDHSFLAQNVVCAGNVLIEENCFIGTGAIISNDVTIARDCVVGAGAVILRDTQPGWVYSNGRAKPVMRTDEWVASSNE